MVYGNVKKKKQELSDLGLIQKAIEADKKQNMKRLEQFKNS